MGFFDNLRKQAASQFVEVIAWLDDTGDALVYRFPVHGQEIKMGARLTVRENQTALLVNEGRAADQFAPGLYRLTTRNLPVLTVLAGWKHGFQSPFKAEVYFFSARLHPDLKWGTATPVMMRDRELGAVRLRAHGTFAIRIADPKAFFAAFVGTKGLTTTEEITGQLRSIILSRFSDAIGEAGIPALDLAARYDELSEVGRRRIAPAFAGFGLDLARFFVESLSLPEEVQAAIDQRSRLGLLGDRLPAYGHLQAAEAMTLAAANPGGAAGAAVGIGAGFAMGHAMTQAIAPAGAQPAPPPAPGTVPAAAAGAAARWHVSLEGRSFGPYTDQTLREMVRSGQVPVSAMAWRPGSSGWAPLAGYPEFADLGPAAPPPPPSPSSR